MLERLIAGKLYCSHHFKQMIKDKHRIKTNANTPQPPGAPTPPVTSAGGQQMSCVSVQNLLSNRCASSVWHMVKAFLNNHIFT